MHKNVLDSNNVVLLIIDIQDKFKGIVSDSDEMLNKTLILTKAFNIMGLPIVYTEQYPKGLGRTVQPLLVELQDKKCFEKFSFSCCGSEEFNDYLNSLNKTQVVVCGVETHVCVNQTVHDLLEMGLKPHLVCDAVSSRCTTNMDVAITKMQQSGAVLTTVEMVLFELMKTAKHEKFREVQKLLI